MDLAYKLERAEQLEPSSEAIRLPTELIERAITRGAEHLASTQRADGSWTGPYGGPMFLLPMYVSSYYIAGRPIAEPRRQGMIDYLRNVQLRDGNVQLRDGSVGLHDEAEEGSIFTSTLAYVALRLLGLSEDDPDVARMRRWIHANGGALGCAPWGKMTLTLLNLHPYEGMYPLLPELWELPEQLPIHPGRLWCHCRQVYLPMAYLYGEKAQAPLDPLLSQLRDEIYGRPYASIDFAKHRDDLAPVDRFEPVKLPMKVVNRVLGVFERFHPPALRKRIQSKLLDHIRYEDQVTGFVRIGPVNAVLNTLVHHFASPGSETVEKSFEELDRYIYPDRGGLMMNGYNSTALWDTAFATQALLASPDVDRHQQTLDRAHDYIRDNQVLEDVPERGHYHRHASRGGWPFSDRKHGWPITDCTAEGLKCALSLEGEVEKPVPEALLEAAMELLFTWQNPEGGWATYELRRAGTWLEQLNPSQVFSRIMVDYPYVECTSASIQALAAVQLRFPRHSARIKEAIARGERYLRGEQRPDGSFEGSWGVCFTYGTWFGVWGLRAAGARSADPAIQRACRYLLDHQNEDGGWGEHYSSCTERRYVQAASHPVNTSWALMALCEGGLGTSEAARRAVRYLVNAQRQDGNWPRQTMVGVFNRTTLIHYDNYRRYFPIWALSLQLAAEQR